MDSLRERKKAKTRKALYESALRLFSEQGFDETTVEQITGELDISPRTFFRYFDCKEEVLFCGWRDALVDLPKYLALRPKTESPMESLKGLALDLGASDPQEEERERFVKRLALGSRSLGEYQLKVIYPAFSETLSAAFAQRLGVDEQQDVRPKLLAALGVSIMTVAKEVWLKDDAVAYEQAVSLAFDSAVDLLKAKQGAVKT